MAGIHLVAGDADALAQLQQVVLRESAASAVAGSSSIDTNGGVRKTSVRGGRGGGGGSSSSSSRSSRRATDGLDHFVVGDQARRARNDGAHDAGDGVDDTDVNAEYSCVEK